MTLKMEVAEDLDRERDDPLGARLFIQVPLDFCVLVTGCSTNQWSSGLRTFIIVFTASDISDVIFVTKLYKRVKSIFDSIGLFTHMNKKDIALSVLVVQPSMVRNGSSNPIALCFAGNTGTTCQG